MNSNLSKRTVRQRVVRFIKDWTLPIAIFLGALFYIVFASVPCLEAEAEWFGRFFETFLPACMFAVLFVTFCKVDFHAMRIVPWHWWVLAFQLLTVLLVVVATVELRLKGMSLIMMEGVLSCIICPCASAAAVVTQKLGGNLEAMTTYTFASNLLTSLLIPLCFPIIAPSAGITFLPAFLMILQKVCLVLVLPMLLAFIVKHTMHRLHAWIVSINDLSYYLWGMSLMVVTGTTAKNITHADSSLGFMLATAVLSLLFCVVQFAAGRCIGRHFGCTIDAGQALGQKNTTFAIWTAVTFLHPLSSIAPGCYILWQNAFNAIEIWQAERHGTLKAS